MGTLAVVVLAHDDLGLEDFVENVRALAPGAEILLYNSGGDPSLGAGLRLEVLPVGRPHAYRFVTGFYLDVLEWLAASGRPFDAVLTAATDMLLVRPDLEEFARAALEQAEYAAPHLRPHLPGRKPWWAPYRAFLPHRETWYDAWGFRHAHGAFDAGQLLSRRYAEALLGHPRYPRIAELARSFDAARTLPTLQEILLPTLAEMVGARARSYPAAAERFIWERPYHTAASVLLAAGTPGALFVHPVGRDARDPARLAVKSLYARNPE